MIKKLVKPETTEKDYVVPFQQPPGAREESVDSGGGTCSPQRNYADEEIDDITF